MDEAKLIQATYLREVVGERGLARAWCRLLPAVKTEADGNYRYHLPSGSLLLEKYRGQAIRAQPWESQGRHWSKGQSIALFVILTRDIGLRRHIARILVDRPRTTLLRIEDFISGMVDALWLNDEKVFLIDKPEYLLIKRLVRKIFSVGCHDLSALVSDWKQWSNNLFHTVSETQTIGPLEPVRYNNIFKALNAIPYISMLWRGERSMLLLQYLSHLVSSRQFPYMGRPVEIKSQAKFIKTVTSDFKPDDQILTELAAAARRIGGICRHIRNQPLPQEAAHLSVTSSGEYGHPIARGAQAMAVKEAMVRILTRVPLSDEKEETPFGTAYLKEGLPIWQTLFRDEFSLSDVIGHELFEPVLSGFPKDQVGRFYGLDRVTGKQILYVAWKELPQLPYNVRAEFVPEMGNKARIVTLAPYWLNVLQAPLAHLLIEGMKYHPSVFSSFHREDQAWSAVKGLVKIGDVSLTNQFVLSSDLSDATNAQQLELTKVMLKSFIDGYGFGVHSRYVELVLGTIGPRLIRFKDGTIVLTKTGVMMGEAIAKPSLTILNLSVEERAFLVYNNRQDLLYTEEPAPYRAWRYVHIGGDDHLAKGPAAYLNLISDTHLRAGSHISPGKHGFSRICVKYTERLINLMNLQYREPIGKSDYCRSTIVDSVKVRLLERGLSTMIKKDNKNVAIGKSEQLAGCLKWLPTDRRFWTFDKKVSIRDLFINRMGPLLPSKALHPRAYKAIHLPTIVGGYGLGFEEEYESILRGCPEPHQWLLSKAMAGLNVKKELRIFRRLNTNTSTRGVEEIQQFEQKIVSQLSDYPSMVNAISWDEVKRLFPNPDQNPRLTIAMAADKGILSFEDFAKRATRGNLFQHLLLGTGKLKVFNTRPYTQTYKHVWSECEKEDLDIYRLPDTFSSAEVAIAIRNIAPQWYFDINQETTTDVGPYCEVGDPAEVFDFRETTYIKKYTEGFPNLIVGKEFLGVKDI